MENKVFPSVLVNNKLYFSFAEAAKCLDYSESTLWREVNKMNIRYLDHPSGKLFLQEWIDEHLERRTVAPRKLIR